MSEDDVRHVMRHPLAMFGSDGWVLTPRGAAGRGQAPSPLLRHLPADPRPLRAGRPGSSRSRRPCTRRPTGRPRSSGSASKGRVQVGADADLVVFDPATVRDLATYADPHQLPGGDRARARRRRDDGPGRATHRRARGPRAPAPLRRRGPASAGVGALQDEAGRPAWWSRVSSSAGMWQAIRCPRRGAARAAASRRRSGPRGAGSAWRRGSPAARSAALGSAPSSRMRGRWRPGRGPARRTGAPRCRGGRAARRRPRPGRTRRPCPGT